MLSKYGNCTHLLKNKPKLKIGCFYKQSWEEFSIFCGHFCENSNYSTGACWISDDYSNLGAMCVIIIGFLPSHIQCTLVE